MLVRYGVGPCHNIPAIRQRRERERFIRVHEYRLFLPELYALPAVFKERFAREEKQYFIVTTRSHVPFFVAGRLSVNEVDALLSGVCRTYNVFPVLFLVKVPDIEKFHALLLTPAP